MLPKSVRHIFVRTRCSTILFLTILIFSAFLLFYGNTSINCQFKVDSHGDRVETIRSYLRMRAEMNGRALVMNDDETTTKESRRKRTGNTSTRKNVTNKDGWSYPSSVSKEVSEQPLMDAISQHSTEKNDPTVSINSTSTVSTKAKVTDRHREKILKVTEESIFSESHEYTQRTTAPSTQTDQNMNSGTVVSKGELRHSKQKATTQKISEDITRSEKKPTSRTQEWNKISFAKDNRKVKNNITSTVLITEDAAPLTPFLKKSTSKNSHPTEGVAMSTAKPSDEEMTDKSLFPTEGDAACEIPILDPFHESVMQYAEIIENKEHCPPNPTYGKLDGAFLMVNVSNVKNVTINFMRRSRGVYPDFYLDRHPTNLLPLINDRPLVLKPGAAGCLARKDAITTLVTIKDKSKVFFASDTTCIFDHIFHFVYDGMILHVQSDTFIKVSEEAGIELVSSLDDGTRGFSLNKDEGSIWLGKDCLGKSEGNDGELSFRKNCSKEDAIEFDLLGFQDRDGLKAIPMQTDGAELIVNTEEGRNHEFFLTVKPLKEDFKELDKISGWPINIVMLMLDSQSSANFKRLMPKTLKVLQSHPTTFLMDSHTVVGDATAPQLAALLTGIDLGDLPEARRHWGEGKSLDDWPLIYKDLHKQGYVTLHTEDDPNLGAFTYALYGFNTQPTHHYARAFWMTATKGEFIGNPTSCLLDKFMHMHSLDYLESLYRNYPGKAKFAFIASSYLTHDEPNNIQYADDDIVSFFEHMRSEGRLNNTFLMIFGDHGSRISRYRDTLQGRLEERLPFMSITLPEWWERGHPEIIASMKHNRKVLTSHFDIHLTLKQLLSNLSPTYTNQTVGKSLFEKIDPNRRTCARAGVQMAWCPCLQYKNISVINKTVLRYANIAVEEINKMLSHSSVQGLCSNLTVHSVLKANRRLANDHVLRFKDAQDDDRCGTCKILLDDDRASILKSFTYIIKLRVKPSNAIIEALVNEYDGKVTIDPSLRRTDSYDSMAKCLNNIDVSLRKFCHCKKSR